jgi:alpha-1,2-mannosyltransferase
VTLASPLAWEHHYGVLLPILAVALGAVLERGTWRAAGLPILALCALIASHHVEALGRLSGTVWNPLQSLLFAAALVLLALLLALRRIPGSRVAPRRVQ